MIQKGKPALVLAPMEGVTDPPMRAFLTRVGGWDLCVSEFLRVSAQPISHKVFMRFVPELANGARTSSGVVVQPQILGGNPEKMALSAVGAVTAGATGIDINFGCPAKTVNRNDGGATILKEPQRIYEITRAVREAVAKDIPVSVKIRLGWESINEVHAVADQVERAGASWLTIHARTRMQGYAPPVYWEPIGEVCRRLSIPIVANGDIWSVDDYKRCREVTGCEHFMLGRSGVVDPYLALRIKNAMGEPSICRETPTERTQWSMLISQLMLECDSLGVPDKYRLPRVKQWVSMATRRHPIPWFDEVKRCSTLAEFQMALQ